MVASSPNLSIFRCPVESFVMVHEHSAKYTLSNHTMHTFCLLTTLSFPRPV